MAISFTPSRLNDLVVDVVLASVARGDVLYRGASKWNNLAAGTSGQFLTSGGAGADPSWTTASGGSPPFIDSTAIIKGSADATKLLRIEVDQFTTGTTRVATPPNSNFTMAGIDIAQTFTAQLVFETGAAGASPVTFRQTGGTPADDELQISNDGTNSTIVSKNGHLILNASATGSVDIDYFGTINFTYNGGGGLTLRDTAGANALILYNAGSTVGAGFRSADCALGSAYHVTWMSGAVWYVGSPDTGMKRAAAGVIQSSDGGSGKGWFQNYAGEASLASNFTKANATLGNTNLSVTLIAGRSYRIEGYLIVSNSTTTEGVQFDFNGGSATATTFDVAFSAVGSVTPGTVASTSLAGVLNYSVVTGTDRIFVKGYIKVNGGGTLILRAAENTTAIGTMTLAAGSWLAFYDTVNL